MTDTDTGLRFDRTVEPRTVHRRHAGTVFLTDFRASGRGYRAGAVLPDRPGFYTAHTAPAHRRLDPLLVLEACRQAQYPLATEHFGVAADTQFILGSCSLSLRPDAHLDLPATGPAALTITIAEPSEKGTGRLARMVSLAFALSVDGAPIGEASMVVGYCTPAAYRELRPAPAVAAAVVRGDLPAPDVTGRLRPAQVGRTDPEDVLLADLSGSRARLIVPFGHRYLFDHPLDHIPGSLLLEAARQLGVTLSADPRSAVLTGQQARFRAFADLDAPVVLHASAGSVTAGQDDVEVASIAYTINGR